MGDVSGNEHELLMNELEAADKENIELRAENKRLEAKVAELAGLPDICWLVTEYDYEWHSIWATNELAEARAAKLETGGVLKVIIGKTAKEGEEE